MGQENVARLHEEIRNLKDELRRREAAIPVHSVRPHQLQAVEDLEEQIEAKQRELRELERGGL